MEGDSLLPGKLPEPLLASFLDRVNYAEGQLLKPPAIGEDTGAVVLENGDILVYTSDPVTFSPSRLGYSSVIINANDIATSGAYPHWFLATLMVPPGAPASQVETILEDIAETCRSLGVSLAGGHTEITGAVTRPVVSGSMFSVVKKERFIDKKAAESGDMVICTKTAGLEGTGILAAELPGELEKAGISAEEAAAARRFYEDISVLPEAKAAVEAGGVSAMHDVTEGGVATALRELAAACGRELECDRDAIPIHPLTRKLCSVFGLHPLGLLGSGSLLICCRPAAADGMILRLAETGIPAAVIGTLGKRGPCVIDLPEFSVDEITKVL